MPTDWGSFVDLICSGIRVVAEEINELGSKSNQEKAEYAAQRLRDPLDDMIKLPIGLEQMDGPIIERIAKPIFKEAFDRIWPEMA